MANEQRHRGDRRRHPRGGRRASDVHGFTPLVFVVDAESRRRDTCEAILAKLHFAVAPFDSSDAALNVMSSLRPEVIAAGPLEYERLRDPLSAQPRSQGIPLVLIPDQSSPDAVLEAVRAATRRPAVAVPFSGRGTPRPA